MVGYNLVHHLDRQVLKTDEESACRLKMIHLKVLANLALYGSDGHMPVLRLWESATSACKPVSDTGFGASACRNSDCPTAMQLAPPTPVSA
jgi:hypothetical protein